MSKKLTESYADWYPEYREYKVPKDVQTRLFDFYGLVVGAQRFGEGSLAVDEDFDYVLQDARTKLVDLWVRKHIRDLEFCNACELNHITSHNSVDTIRDGLLNAIGTKAVEWFRIYAKLALGRDVAPPTADEYKREAAGEFGTGIEPDETKWYVLRHKTKTDDEGNALYWGGPDDKWGPLDKAMPYESDERAEVQEMLPDKDVTWENAPPLPGEESPEDIEDFEIPEPVAIPSVAEPERTIAGKSSDYEKRWKASVAATKATGVDNDEIGAWAFNPNNLSWGAMYGGWLWRDMALASIRLREADNEDEKIKAVDHVFDLEHNTGAGMNKISEYTGSWLPHALNVKYLASSPMVFLDRMSPTAQKIYQYENYLRRRSGNPSLTQKDMLVSLLDSHKKSLQAWEDRLAKPEEWEPGEDKEYIESRIAEVEASIKASEYKLENNEYGHYTYFLLYDQPKYKDVIPQVVSTFNQQHGSSGDSVSASASAKAITVHIQNGASAKSLIQQAHATFSQYSGKAKEAAISTPDEEVLSWSEFKDVDAYKAKKSVDSAQQLLSGQGQEPTGPKLEIRLYPNNQSDIDSVTAKVMDHTEGLYVSLVHSQTQGQYRIVVKGFGDDIKAAEDKMMEIYNDEQLRRAFHTGITAVAHALEGGTTKYITVAEKLGIVPPPPPEAVQVPTPKPEPEPEPETEDIEVKLKYTAQAVKEHFDEVIKYLKSQDPKYAEFDISKSPSGLRISVTNDTSDDLLKGRLLAFLTDLVTLSPGMVDPGTEVMVDGWNWLTLEGWLGSPAFDPAPNTWNDASKDGDVGLVLHAKPGKWVDVLQFIRGHAGFYKEWFPLKGSEGLAYMPRQYIIRFTKEQHGNLQKFVEEMPANVLDGISLTSTGTFAVFKQGDKSKAYNMMNLLSDKNVDKLSEYYKLRDENIETVTLRLAVENADAADKVAKAIEGSATTSRVVSAEVVDLEGAWKAIEAVLSDPDLRKDVIWTGAAALADSSRVQVEYGPTEERSIPADVFVKLYTGKAATEIDPALQPSKSKLIDVEMEPEDAASTLKVPDALKTIAEKDDDMMVFVLGHSPGVQIEPGSYVYKLIPGSNFTILDSEGGGGAEQFIALKTCKGVIDTVFNVADAVAQDTITISLGYTGMPDQDLTEVMTVVVKDGKVAGVLDADGNFVKNDKINMVKTLREAAKPFVKMIKGAEDETFALRINKSAPGHTLVDYDVIYAAWAKANNADQERHIEGGKLYLHVPKSDAVADLAAYLYRAGLLLNADITVHTFSGDEPTAGYSWDHFVEEYKFPGEFVGITSKPVSENEKKGLLGELTKALSAPDDAEMLDVVKKLLGPGLPADAQGLGKQPPAGDQDVEVILKLISPNSTPIEKDLKVLAAHHGATAIGDVGTKQKVWRLYKFDDLEKARKFVQAASTAFMPNDMGVVSIKFEGQTWKGNTGAVKFLKFVEYYGKGYEKSSASGNYLTLSSAPKKSTLDIMKAAMHKGGGMYYTPASMFSFETQEGLETFLKELLTTPGFKFHNIGTLRVGGKVLDFEARDKYFAGLVGEGASDEPPIPGPEGTFHVVVSGDAATLTPIAEQFSGELVHTVETPQGESSVALGDKGDLVYRFTSAEYAWTFAHAQGVDAKALYDKTGAGYTKNFFDDFYKAYVAGAEKPAGDQPGAQAPYTGGYPGVGFSVEGPKVVPDVQALAKKLNASISEVTPGERYVAYWDDTGYGRFAQQLFAMNAQALTGVAVDKVYNSVLGTEVASNVYHNKTLPSNYWVIALYDSAPIGDAIKDALDRWGKTDAIGSVTVNDFTQKNKSGVKVSFKANDTNVQSLTNALVDAGVKMDDIMITAYNTSAYVEAWQVPVKQWADTLKVVYESKALDKTLDQLLEGPREGMIWRWPHIYESQPMSLRETVMGV